MVSTAPLYQLDGLVMQSYHMPDHYTSFLGCIDLECAGGASRRVRVMDVFVHGAVSMVLLCHCFRDDGSLDVAFPGWSRQCNLDFFFL